MNDIFLLLFITTTSTTIIVIAVIVIYSQVFIQKVVISHAFSDRKKKDFINEIGKYKRAPKKIRKTRDPSQMNKHKEE